MSYEPDKMLYLNLFGLPVMQNYAKPAFCKNLYRIQKRRT